MDPIQWFYAKDGRQLGPVSSADMRRLAEQGVLGPDDLIWREGLEDWVPASRIKNLFAGSGSGSAPAAKSASDDDDFAPYQVSQTGDDDRGADPISRPRRPRRRRELPEYAGFWKRFAAHLIDSIILFIPNFLAGMMMGAVMGTEPGQNGAPDTAAVIALVLFYGFAFLLQFLYYVLMECSSHQGTLGKMALGIKVTDLEGQRISFMHASGRWFAKMINSCTCLIGFIMAGFTEQKQALHDMMASTLVVDRE